MTSTATPSKIKWTELAESEGSSNAERIPATDRTRVKIAKVKRESKDKVFQSASGDPQILLVFVDAQAREETSMYTLSEKAIWTLAKLMGCCDPPINLARMEQDGIEPSHFANEEFANKVLTNRQLDISVSHKNKFAEITPLKPLVPTSTAASTPTNTPATPTPTTPVTPTSDDAPPGPVKIGRTKKEAWDDVVVAWGPRFKEDPVKAKQGRIAAWTEAVKKRGKPEDQFTPNDWHDVAIEASDETPF